MPLDLTTPDSPGWWLKQCEMKLHDRLPRLEMLNSYMENDPPPPTEYPNARRAYEIFRKRARLNMAELIVESLRERLRVRAINTAVPSTDFHGDSEAWGVYRANQLEVELPDVLESMLSMGDGYMVAALDDEGVAITGEDPRQLVTIHDPVRQSRIIAAAKFWRDPIVNRDYAMLWRPAGPGEAVGRRWVAFRPFASRAGSAVRLDAHSWSWLASQGGPEGEPTKTRRVPVVRFRNRKGIAEFERHLDVLDRINHMILQRMVIATMQAFKQRALKGDLPAVYPDDHPRAGEKIDYDEMFESDPGALWLLPASVEVWESGQVDLQGILSAVQDDMKHLAAVTRRPITMLSPDANQSAEGASLTREGLVFATEDRQMRAGNALNQIISIAFELLGDQQRTDLTKLETVWYPAERHSLSVKGTASQQAKTAGLSLDFILEHIWQLTPEEVSREKSNQLANLMLGGPLEDGLPATQAETGQQAAGGQALSMQDLELAARALGQLRRAGVDREAAAAQVGLTGLQWSELVPVSLRDPAGD